MRSSRLAVVGGLALSSLLGLGCKDPPETIERMPPPTRDEGDPSALLEAAYRDALTEALPKARAALIAAEPLAAWQVGLGPASPPPLDGASRRALETKADPAREALAELDEAYLPAAEVVIVRALRFALTRINDDLRRRPVAAEDPMAGLERVAANLDELRYRLVHDDCDAACEALPAALARSVETFDDILAAASLAQASWAADQAEALAVQARALAATSLSEGGELRAGLEALALALDAHATWLGELHALLPAAPHQIWSSKPAARRPGDPTRVRLPDLIGAGALVRRMSVEDRVDLVPGSDLAVVARHIGRWQRLHAQMVPAGFRPPEPEPVDQARCAAALERIRSGLAAVPEVEAPRLDCARYLALIDGEVRDEGQLVLELLDYGVIEPQRRAARAQELPELALVTGRRSSAVHLDLRRIMLLARLDEPAAAARALAGGRRALCLAGAALWIHTELGPPAEVSIGMAGRCDDLGSTDEVIAQVTGDPRGALAGFGLAQIGDEPARMVGFDRFFWAPLGLMKTLATPKGMHPDAFTLPDDPQPGPEPEVEVKVEVETF